MIKNVIYGLAKNDNGEYELTFKPLYFGLKNVLDVEEFARQVNCIKALDMHDTLVDKINNKIAILERYQDSDNYEVDKARKMSIEIDELKDQADFLSVEIDKNYIYFNDFDKMSIYFAYAFLGLNSIEICGTKNLVKELRNYYNTAENARNSKAIKKTIIDFCNTKIVTTDTSGIFKNFKLDHLNNKTLNDIISTCASVGTWSKNGLTMKTSNDKKIVKELFKIILVEKYGAKSTAKTKPTKTYRYSL